MRRIRTRNRIVSILLILIMMFTSMDATVFAAEEVEGPVSDIPAGSNTTSNGMAGSDGNLSDPGVMLTLRTISNTTTSDEKAAITEHNAAVSQTGATYWSDMNYSFDKDYLHKYPTFWKSYDVANKSVLIVRSDGTTSPFYGKNEYCYDGQNSATYGGHYKVVRRLNPNVSTSQEAINQWLKDITVVSDDIYNSANGVDGLRDQFKLATLPVSTVQSLVADIDSLGNIDTPVSSFTSIFRDTGVVSTYLNSISKLADGTPDGAIKAKLKYLDVLVLVNYMSGSRSWDVIESYLKTLNEDNADEFSVLWMQSVVCAGGEWFSFPSYFAYCTTNSWDYYTAPERMDTASVAGANSDTYPSWSKWVQKSYNLHYEASGKYKAPVKGSLGQMYGNGLYAWVSDQSLKWHAGYTFMPLDKYGKATGAFGYTAFAVAGSRGKQIISEPQIVLTATTPFAKCTYDSNTNTPIDPAELRADIEVSLIQSTEQKTKITDLFRQQAEKGTSTATLTLTYSSQADAGAETNSNGGFDTKVFQHWADKTNVNVGFNEKATTTVTGVTLDEFSKYMDGTYKFVFADTGIVPDVPSCINAGSKLINRYSVTATLTWGGISPVTITFTSAGRQGIGTSIAYDTVEWSLVPDNTVERPKGQFYSVPEQAYAEIKDNVPGAENFEAMAGVPTTEDMYVGFGASEFAVNMDVQYAVNSEQGGFDKRYYTLIYKVANVYDTDDDCYWTCPGHGTNPINSIYTFYS